MTRTEIVWLCCVVCCAAVLPAAIGKQAAAQSAPAAGPAQQEPKLAPRPAPAPPSGEGHIRLNVMVTDKSGKPIAGLTRNDFTLYDDKQSTPILSFEAMGAGTPNDPPVTVILVIDGVNIPSERVIYERQQMEAFLRQNGGHLEVPVGILFFGDTGLRLEANPSSDGNALAAAIDHSSDLRTLTRSAGAWGAIERYEQSVRGLGSVVATLAKQPGRKLVIWIGTGWPILDNPNITISEQGEKQSFSTIVEMNRTLREGNVVLYSVSAGNGLAPILYQEFLKGVTAPKKTQPGDLSLLVWVTQSGGKIEGPDNDMASQIDTCMKDTGSYYRISFDPPRADHVDEYHDLKVVVNHPGAVVRTNTGYYNEPPGQ